MSNEVFAQEGWVTALKYEDEIIEDLKKRTGGKVCSTATLLFTLQPANIICLCRHVYSRHLGHRATVRLYAAALALPMRWPVSEPVLCRLSLLAVRDGVPCRLQVLRRRA